MPMRNYESLQARLRLVTSILTLESDSGHMLYAQEVGFVLPVTSSARPQGDVKLSD